MALSRSLGASVRNLRRESRFIFTGSVEGVARSTVSLLPAHRGTAVVHVEHIHYAPEDLQDQLDQSVTLLLAEESTASPNQRLVFFTTPILFGETMAAREVGRIEVPDDIEALQEMMARVTAQMTEEDVRAHVGSTDAIVRGRVVSVRSVSETTALTASEHDPDWWAAVVRVTRSIKGDHKGQIEVRYPNSHDIRWYRAPKLREGQEGIFMLHRDGEEVGGVALSLIHPDDFLTGDADQESLIRSFV
jgi:hypothetical protein